jgi:lysophospholipid acyltransferase (LPLAT)-like uncharacterized protein
VKLDWPNDRLAYLWGRTIARYCRIAVSRSRIRIVDEPHYPNYPSIFVGWHATNVIAMALHCTHRPGARGISFAPTGRTGVVIQGWLDGIGGIEAVHLPFGDATATRPALRSVSLAVREGAYVVVAVDGPHGPAGVVRPGALWLARHTGVPIVPIGFAAWPAVRVPRWDRLIVPLPGADVVAVFGKPTRIERGAPVDGVMADYLGCLLDTVTERAWSIVGGMPSYRARSPSSSVEES